jgi:NAD-dependent DNA ligase
MNTKVIKVAGVKGMATKTAQLFVENIPTFIAFLKDTALEYKLDTSHIEPITVIIDHPLSGKTVVMTGVRDQSVSDALKSVGAKLGTSVSKNTAIVVAKSKEEDTGKAGEARKLGIPIMTPLEFMNVYFSNNV